MAKLRDPAEAGARERLQRKLQRLSPADLRRLDELIEDDDDAGPGTSTGGESGEAEETVYVYRGPKGLAQLKQLLGFEPDAGDSDSDEPGTDGDGGPDNEDGSRDPASGDAKDPEPADATHRYFRGG